MPQRFAREYQHGRDFEKKIGQEIAAFAANDEID